MPTTSIVSVTMNRQNNIVCALHSWIRLPVAEIIIVDWCSTIPLSTMIPTYLRQDKLRIVRVDGFDKWVLSWAFNLGMSLATSEYILKLDADVIVDEDFFDRNSVPPSDSFYRGFWDRGTPSLNGQCWFRRVDGQEAGFYNENITTYGYDDCDFYGRLTNLRGLNAIQIQGLTHLENGMHSMRFQDRQDLAVETEYNRLVAAAFSWGPGQPSTERFCQKGENEFELVDKTMPFYNDLFHESLRNNCNKQGRSWDEVNAASLETLLEWRKERPTKRPRIGTEKKFLVLRVVQGIGNRLRTLVSFSVEFRRRGYAVYVLWNRSRGFDDSHFTDFFSFPETITWITEDDIKRLKFDLTVNFPESSGMGYDLFRYRRVYIESSDLLSDVMTRNWVFWNKFKSIGMSPQLQVVFHYLRHEVLPKRYHAYHIRRGDTITCPEAHHYAVSSIAAFAKAIAESELPCVVVTDDHEFCLQNLPRERFIIANRVSLNTDKTFMQEKNGVVLDAIDMCILMGAEKIFGTNWSSFSLVASWISGKPHEVVVESEENANYLTCKRPELILGV